MTSGYRVTENASLRERTTFGVPARAPWLIEIDDAAALDDVLALPQVAGGETLVIGGGSNLLFAGDAPGAVIAMVTHDLRVLSDDGDHALVRADAGVAWHPLVMWTLDQGLCGLENLALIPGTVGASPIQNIGAYGTEVGEFIHIVEALDRRSGTRVRLDRDTCAFAYRDSVFKHEADRYLVTAVEFLLPRTPSLRLDYAGIRDELGTMGISAPTARDVGEAVIRIRQRKLPDPAVVGNAGSFFKNPIVSQAQADALLVDYPTLPVFRGDAVHNRKLSAAWMIEACGWKGHRDGDAGVSAAHALVLVNHGEATGAQLLALARRIADSVHARFGVPIEPEPKIIGARW
jgi:UDP-N-acetylmuramate dehydrogenase